MARQSIERALLTCKLVSLACRVEQQKALTELEKLQNTLESKEAEMARIMSGDGQISTLKGRYERVIKDIQAERDELKKERMDLLQVTTLGFKYA